MRISELCRKRARSMFCFFSSFGLGVKRLCGELKEGMRRRLRHRSAKVNTEEQKHTSHLEKYYNINSAT